MARPTTRPALIALVALAALASACGGADVSGDVPVGTDPAAGTCLEGTPDCVDADLGHGEPVGEGDGAVDEGALIRSAEDLLGMSEDDALAVDGDVRLGRRGDEHMMLIENYVVGRRTIATEDDGTGTFRVVEVTVELTEGPHLVKRGG